MDRRSCDDCRDRAHVALIKEMMKTYSPGVYVVMLIATMLVCGGVAAGVMSGKNEVETKSKTVLDIRNPFAATIYLEVKCDNIAGTIKYRYYNRIVVPKKSYYKLVVPSNLRYCEVWGLDFKLF